MSNIDPRYTHFNKRCIDISTMPDSSRSVIQFSDGTSAEADVVLIASGIKSRMRSAVTGKPSDANVAYGNNICYRGLVPADQAKAGGVTEEFKRGHCYVGEDKVHPRLG